MVERPSSVESYITAALRHRNQQRFLSVPHSLHSPHLFGLLLRTLHHGSLHFLSRSTSNLAGKERHQKESHRFVRLTWRAGGHVMIVMNKHTWAQIVTHGVRRPIDRSKELSPAPTSDHSSSSDLCLVPNSCASNFCSDRSTAWDRHNKHG